MPARTSDTRSLPYRTAERNTRRTETSQVRARCAARLACITDTRLTMGARCLYVLLDDYSGLRAECWPHQATAAERLGRSVRSVKRWIAELVAAGYIRIRRTQSGNRYRLAWAVPGNNAATQIGPSEVPTPERAYSEPVQELVAGDRGNNNSIESDEWGFALDDAVRLWNWAANQP